MPEKTDEERERIAKKLAEQRAKIEGMPTTAKVSALSDVTYYVLWSIFKKNMYLYLFFFHSSKLMNLNQTSMKLKILFHLLISQVRHVLLHVALQKGVRNERNSEYVTLNVWVECSSCPVAYH